MMTFEVTGGLHVEPDGRIYKRGDRFQSRLEMDKLFGIKFRRTDAGDSSPTAAAPEVEEFGDIEAMTLEELRQFAEGEEIDLGDAKKKADVLRVIKEALGE